MAADTNFLATKDHWAQRWSSQDPHIEFDPEKPLFRDIHKLFQKHLPKGPNVRCLEVGCYPGTYLWYFHKYFGHHVSGLEYVGECAAQCQELMQKKNIDAEIIHGDLFSYSVPEDKLWDVVTSFGFIEHFDDVVPSIQCHLNLLKPGGLLAIVIPNHSGLNGKIMKAVDHEKYKIHNHMDYAAMANAVKKTGQAEIIEGGYYGHIGFWNTALYSKVRKKGKFPYYAVRAPLYVIEAAGQYIMPNTQFFSPNAAIIAKKL